MNNAIIHKHRLTGPQTEMEIPANAEFISVGEDPDGAPSVWYMFDGAVASTRKRIVHVIFTGNPFDPCDKKFIGTFRNGILMCHAYEQL
jgi:hypothetical protein